MAENLTFTINLNGSAYEGTLKLYDSIEKVTKSVNNASSAFSRWGDMAFKLNSIVDSVRNISSAFEGLAAPAMTKEMQKMNMRTLFQGNAEAAAEMYDKISKYAKDTVYDRSGLIDAQNTMMSFGISGEKAFSTLQQIGDIAMGDRNKMQSLSLAYAQMSSTGKLTGQDLMQMINAGFNPLNEISKKTGKSIGELKEEMSKGAISADMVAEAFRSATAEGGLFYNAAQSASETTAGKLARLNEKIDDMKASFFEATGIIGIYATAMAPIVTTITQLTPLVTQLLVPMGTWIYQNLAAVVAETSHWGIMGMLKLEMNNLSETMLGKGIRSLVEYTKNTYKSIAAMIAENGILGTLKIGFKGLTTSIWSSTTAFLASPIGWIAVAIGAVAGAVVALWKNWDKMSLKTKMFLMPFIGNLMILVKVIKTIKKYWDVVTNAFKGDGLLAGIKKLGKVILAAILSPLDTIAKKYPKLAKFLGFDKVGAWGKSLKTELDKELGITNQEKKFGINDNLISAVNGGSGETGSGTTTEAGKSTEAIATGGTRNTEVHITIGDMIRQVTFNGTTAENKQEIERNFAECLYRVLGMAQVSV